MSTENVPPSTLLCLCLAFSLTHWALMQQQKAFSIPSTSWQGAVAGLVCGPVTSLPVPVREVYLPWGVGPPAELPELPVTAWRHTVVAYPAVKFNPDPLESGSLSCPSLSPTLLHQLLLALPVLLSLSLSLPPSLFHPLCSTAVSSFNERAETRGFFEAALCVSLYVFSVCSAFVCCACTYSSSCFPCLKMRTRPFPTLANCKARFFILICHSTDRGDRGVLALICCC